MNYLFIHQNAPGQFLNIVSSLATESKNRVVVIGQRQRNAIPGVEFLLYKPAREVTPKVHHYVTPFEQAIINGQGVVRVLLDLKRTGFAPDIICAHPGWGEALFLKDIYPNTPVIAYCEFFYRSRGSDYSFGNLNPPLDGDLRIRAKNATLLISLEACDWGITPTRWQLQQHPDFFQKKISVIHEGIDTEICRPNPNVELILPNGRVLTRDNDVVTYVARNLEPYRGFPSFMEAAERLCARRPNVDIIVVGGDDISYGVKSPEEGTWREYMLRRVTIDPERIHFLGRVPYQMYLSVLQISSVHLYLTVPFILSWSVLEAMACECLVIGSSTLPVTEVIESGHNGILVDFFNPSEIARAVENVLNDKDKMSIIRNSARKTILERYDLKTICLPQAIELINYIMK